MRSEVSVAQQDASLSATHLHVIGNEEEAKGIVFDAPLDLRQAEGPLKALAGLDVQACGTMIEAKVAVNKAMRSLIQEAVHEYLEAKEVDGHRTLFAKGYPKGTRWSVPGGAGPEVQPGFRLVRVGNKTQAFWKSSAEFVSALTKSDDEVVEVAFEAGLDFRGCWGQLQDPTGHGVCSDAVFKDLRDDLAKVDGKYTAALDARGATVISLKGVTVKSVKDLAQYRLAQEVLKTYSKNMTWNLREDGACYSTALTPICAIVQASDVGSGSTGGQTMNYWMVMRKIELPEAEEAIVVLDDNAVGHQVLKGPKFASEGKSYFSSSKAWHNLDAGFVKMFPRGLGLEDCGSREAAVVVPLDAAVLAATQMNDYAFSGKFYKRPADDKYSCACSRASPGRPIWPMVFDVQIPGKQKLRIAYGITDYLERVDKPSWYQVFDKMTPPDQYKEYFMRMWPYYFHLPKRKYNLEKKLLVPTTNAIGESLVEGMRVRALEKIKWTSRTSQVVVRMKKATGYYEQMVQTSSETSTSGSKYKVEPGDFGTIQGTWATFTGHTRAAPMLAVQWDDVKDVKGTMQVFRAEPWQVMAVPRVTVAGTEPPSQAQDTSGGRSTGPRKLPTKKKKEKSSTIGQHGCLAWLAAILVVTAAAVP